jgi:aspartyl aminopeptidase
MKKFFKALFILLILALAAAAGLYRYCLTVLDEIPLQTIANRNTIRSGSTLGPVIGAHLPMSGCDIGVPMWAMHSARETIAVSDYQALVRLVTSFFNV